MMGLVTEARKRVARIDFLEARDWAPILDLRKLAELASDGPVEGALHVLRGVPGSRADPKMPTVDTTPTGAREGGMVHVPCASGTRAALAGATLERTG